MRFALTQDQELMRNAFRELLAGACSPALLRTAFTGEGARIPGLWARLAEFGALGALVPESSGGLGLGEVELALLLEEAGRAALPEPLLETSAAAAPLLVAFGSDARAVRALEAALSGTTALALGFETSRHVAAADLSETLVMQHGDELHLVPRSRAELVPEPSVDRTRRLFRVSHRPDASTCVATGPEVSRAFADAFDRAALGAAAELVGLGARVVEMAVEYAKTRQQFGQPIGAFQAVKHLLANAHLALAFARPLVYRAAHSLAHADPARSEHVSSAKALASEAAQQAARASLQVHGAIGYSYEHDLHLWMKRIWCRGADYGDAAWHRGRVASAIL